MDRAAGGSGKADGEFDGKSGMLAEACVAMARAAEAGDDAAASEAMKRATELADGISPGSQQVLSPVIFFLLLVFFLFWRIFGDCFRQIFLVVVRLGT